MCGGGGGGGGGVYEQVNTLKLLSSLGMLAKSLLHDSRTWSKAPHRKQCFPGPSGGDKFIAKDGSMALAFSFLLFLLSSLSCSHMLRVNSRLSGLAHHDNEKEFEPIFFVREELKHTHTHTHARARASCSENRKYI